MLQVGRSAWIACKQKEKQLALPGANKDKFEAEIEHLMDMSGAVPMYLNQFCDFFVKAKPGEFRMQHAMSTYAAESLAPVVDGNLVEFARSLLEKGSERFFEFAELFLHNDIVPSDRYIPIISSKFTFLFFRRAGWDKRVKPDLEIITVPGDHVSMLQEPHVRMLAKKLQVCLDRAVIKTEQKNLGNSAPAS